MDPASVSLKTLFANIVGFFGVTAPGSAGLSQLAASLWLWVTIIGYLVSAAGMGLIVYILVRLFDLRKREEEYYFTPIAGATPGHQATGRFAHINALARGTSPSEWREAIIEADIMLDDALAAQGYTGDLAEKLRQAPLATLHGAQEAHGVRNRIAHQGSLFDLSPTLMTRTLAQYEATFRELGAI